MATDTIEVYADYVCPFCYLGRQSLARYRADRTAELAVEWHPFDLRGQDRGPDGELPPDVHDHSGEYFDQVRENVARLREEYDAGDMLGIDEVPDVDSLDAQVVSATIQRDHPDTWEAFDEALYEALWEEGRDIGDVDVLTDVAASVGLDDEVAREAVRDEDRRAAVEEAFGDARQRGITGVPTFVYGEHAARGAVPPEHLERLVEG